MEEAGKLAEAEAYLEGLRDKIVDKISLMEALCRLQLAQGRLAAAEAGYRRLLAINPDCLEYHAGFRASLGMPPGGGGLAPEQAKRLADEYAALREQHRFRRGAALARCLSAQRVAAATQPEPTRAPTPPAAPPAAGCLWTSWTERTSRRRWRST